MLAPALGTERAVELVNATAQRFGIPLETMSKEQAVEILARLSSEPGLVGVAARLARLRFVGKSSSAPPATIRTTDARPVSIPATSKRSLRSGRDVLVELVSPALGEPRAAEVVDAAARALGLPPHFDDTQGLQVLDAMSTVDGMVGTVARFCKARYILGR